MPDQITGETRKQLETLCRKISVSRRLDAEIQRELYGHMEDRLLAHMNGEIPLTEEDAFILVREHFGDPAMIKERIQEVHAEEAAVSMGRRLVAAFVACTAVNVISSVLQLCLVGVPAFLGAWRVPLQVSLFGAIELVFVPGAMYLALRPWRRRMDRGEPVWFQSAPAGRMLAVFAVTAIVAVVSIPFFFWVQSLVPNLLDENMGIPGTLAALASILAMGAIWIWFCDQPPRTRRNLLQAAGAWAAVLALLSLSAAYSEKTPWQEMLINASAGVITGVVFALLSLLVFRLTARFRNTSAAPLEAE